MTELVLTSDPAKDTATTKTIEWTPPPAAQGYVFLKADGTRLSSTLDGSRSTVKVAKSNLPVTVRALRTEAEGVYPPVVPPPPPTGTLAGGTGLDLNGSAFPGGLTGSPAFIIVAAANAKAAATAHPHALIYMDGPSVSTKFNCGCSLDYAQKNNLLRSGLNGYGAYCGDLANPTYQNEWARYVIATAVAGGVFGVFIDDICQNVPGLFPGSYSTWQQGRDAMLSFVKAVCPKLTAAGLYLMLNADGFVSGVGGDDGQLQIEWWKLLRGSAPAMMQEFWMQAPGDESHMRTSAAGYLDNAREWLELPKWAEANDVQFVGQTYGSSQNVEYARAAALSVASTACVSSRAGGVWTRSPGHLTVDLAHGTGSLG